MQAWEEDLINREESRQEGLEAGRRIGLEENLRKFIQNLLKRNTPDADIIELTGCTQELINEIRNKK